MAAAADDTEPLSERQENEVELLKAIYSEDLTDLRENDAWKVARPPEIKVTLRPQESMCSTEAHVSLDMLVRCSANYPECVPELRLENSKGLSNQQLADLKQQLDAMAKSLTGEVMIFELCQLVQTFLRDHNRPSMSFYEEMVFNQKKHEEKLAQEQQKKLDLIKKREQKQLQEIEEEMQRRREALKEDTRRRRQEAKEMERHSLSEPSTPISEILSMTPIAKDSEQRLRSNSALDRGTPANHLETLALSRPERRRRTSTPLSGRSDSEHDDSHNCQDHHGTTTIQFNTKRKRTIHRGKCLGHSSRGSTVYVAMDTDSGELAVMSEWVLQWSHLNRKLDLEEKKSDDQEAEKYGKQVGAIEKEINSLLKLHHKNLAHYIAFKHERDKGKITVNVLVEHVGGGSLNYHLKNREPLQMETLRHYTMQILEALAFLHNKAVVHRDIRASSLLLDTGGRVRLADYSIYKRLSELASSCDTERQGVRFEENAPPSLGRGGKKSDIYRLGVVLLSLAQGRPVVDILPEVPTHLSPDFSDFLIKCLFKDERYRASAHELMEHTFVKTPIYPTITSPKKTADDMENEGTKLRRQDSSEEPLTESEIPFIPASDSGSRLQNEFVILKYIGKGAFGDVIKVRNKLDDRFYAIKRIPLNPRSKVFTRKITREVKLLSRLSHENVVRYFNSWIETSEELAPSDTSSSTISSQRSMTPSTSTKPAASKSNFFHNTLGFIDEIETLAPPPLAEGSVEWSVSADLTRSNDDSTSSDEDADDDDDVFGTSFLPRSDSEDDGIEFEEESKFGDWSTTEDSVKDAKQLEVQKADLNETLPKLQFLYIQMEFCEKSTLRNCIDAGMYLDMDRVWRLFREIIEGLLHIHEQGMIHRDLKPVNIFLDSNDHVKIGDFGLATSDIISKQQTSIIDMNLNPSFALDGRSNGYGSRSDSLGADGMTGNVGTALYVSPEVMDIKTMAYYNQKVDMYSLGVIFFEMCYHPLDTGMERIQVLTKLRQPVIELPGDFDVDELLNQAAILKWLLNHDPTKRPNSKELLQSDYLPPAQMEEAELNEVLRSTIANPESKSYRHMLNAIFSQTVMPANDFAYDMELYKTTTFSQHFALTQQLVNSTLERIFQKHGAVKVCVPLLMPRCSVYEDSEAYVCIMDHCGGLVSLPYDLRVPFARYIARQNITQMKRYSIEKVYRENRLYGSHPRELAACSFDIVAPASAGLVPDAEVIHTVYDIITEFHVLQNRNYYLRINHTSLLKAILMHCDIPEGLHQSVYAILGDTRAERQKKFQVQTRLCSLSVSEQSVAALYNFIDVELSFSKASSMLRCITKTKGEAGSLAKKGLHEIETIISLAESMGCKLQPVLALGLVYSIQHFSGSVFQVVSNVRRKKKPTMDVLAAGGRYDPLVAMFRKPSSLALTQSVVGINIASEKVVAAAVEQEGLQVPAVYDVLVCSLGHRSMIKERLCVLRDLWQAGLRADILYDDTESLEDIQDYCRNNGITYIVILKDVDTGSVKVRYSEKERVVEKKVNLMEVAEFLLQKMQQAKIESVETSQSATSSKTLVINSQSSSESTSSQHTGSGLPPYSICFLQADNSKMAKNVKRQCETQIYSNISSALANISHKSRVEVIAAELNVQVLKTVAAYLDLNGEEYAFENSISGIMEKHPRYRKYLTKIIDYIHELKYETERSCPVIVLYGLKDDSHRVLL